MLSFRLATNTDTDILYKWANDETARLNSYNSAPIHHEDHVNWFQKRLQDGNTYIYIFSEQDGELVGQVRLESDPQLSQAIISISVDKDHRGKGLSSLMLKMATEDYIKNHHSHTIIAYIFKSNPASYHSFLKAGFTPLREEPVKGIDSYILSYSVK